MELYNQTLESIIQLMEVLARGQGCGHLQGSRLTCVLFLESFSLISGEFQPKCSTFRWSPNYTACLRALESEVEPIDGTILSPLLGKTEW